MEMKCYWIWKHFSEQQKSFYTSTFNKYTVRILKRCLKVMAIEEYLNYA